MGWRNDLLAALGDTTWAPRDVLVTLWLFWKVVPRDEKNLYEQLRVEIAADPLGAGRSLPDQTDLLQKLFSGSDANFIREIAKLTRRLDDEIARSIETILRPVGHVETARGEKVWVIKRRRPLPLNAPYVRQGVPLRSLFRNLHLLPDWIADGIPVTVKEGVFDGSYNEQTLSGSTLSCHAKGYPTDCRYSVAIERPSASLPHERFAFPKLEEGAEKRLEVAVSVESSVGQETCSITLFPELSIDTETADAIRKHYRNTSTKEGRKDRTRLNLLCAGSFHRESRLRDYSNHAELIDLANGQVILHQDKLRAFKATFLEPPKDEGIVFGRSVQILLSPVGLIAILICRDFGDEAARIFLELDVDVVLVPSMGDAATFSAMEKAAKEFCRSYCGVVICAIQSPPDAEGKWVAPPTGEVTTFVAFQDNDGRPVFRHNPVGPVSVPF